MAGLIRHLDAMLALQPDERKHYSFLQSGEWQHGPIAIATVDPAVVRLDMHCAPPDRWHGVVDMIDMLTGAVRKGLKKRKQAEVCMGHGRVAGTASTCQAYAHSSDKPCMRISRSIDHRFSSAASGRPPAATCTIG